MASLPTSRLVAAGWLQMAVPGVQVGKELPAASDELRANGFLRVPVVGGSVDQDVAFYSPVIGVQCWWPPALRSEWNRWTRAEQLAARVVEATFDPALMGVVIDLSGLGDIGRARVHDVTALGIPQEGEDDPSDWGRYDVDLLINWTATGA